MGAGTWVHLPEKRQAPIAASVANVRRWAHALFTEPTPLAALRELRIPTLCMVGARSTAGDPDTRVVDKGPVTPTGGFGISRLTVALIASTLP